MKLRNKENRLTGKLTYLDFNIDESEKEIDLTILLDNRGGECIDRQFYSLDELKKFFEEWEEVKEPLIKDPKIRKSVRAWAEANLMKKIKYEYVEQEGSYFSECGCSVRFYEDLHLTNRREYTVEELCGEEQE